MHSALYLVGLLAVINVSFAIPSANPLPVAQPGTQFITGACKSDSDCASACCAFNTGKCAGPVIAQQRDGGCGFGNAAPNADATKALGSNIAAPGVTGGDAPAAMPNTQAKSPASAAAAGTQFITGACTSDAQCASGCCGFKSGKCAGPIVAQERDGGCGFGDSTPNANAAVALGFKGAAPGARKRSFHA
ncbi:MAG: hypothetical protein L6R36_001103 [Xanthoria steineri]|nr:MAG: hypothetical protein L6R36_001103 [Xanthoria steineri]